MAERSVGVGIVGYGVAGELFHGRVVKGVQGLEVRAVSTTSSARAAAARAEHGDAVDVCAPDDVVHHPDVDLVVVSTPNVAHAVLGRKALLANKHVVIDKPVATTYEEARAMTAGLRRSTAWAIPFHNRRWDGDFLTLTELARTGELGRIRCLESRFEYVEGLDDAGWRGDPAEFGGPLYDLGPHLIDQACLLLGDVRSVWCETDVVRAGGRVPDTVFLSMNHECGARSHIHLSAAFPTGLRFRLRGDDGEYVKRGLDPQETQLERGMDPSFSGWAEEAPERWGHLSRNDNPPRRVPTQAGRYQDFYEAVRKAVVSGEQPPVDFADGVRVSRIVDAALAAAASGSRQVLRH